MRTRIQKWGNSLGVRIPKAYAAQARLEENSEIEISLDGERIVLTAQRRVWELEDLLRKVNRANQHGQVDWGDRAGKEVW